MHEESIRIHRSSKLYVCIIPVQFHDFLSFLQVNNLREIQALRRLSPHEHVISLEEVLYDQPTGRLALVFELMEANLYELIRGKPPLPLIFNLNSKIHFHSSFTPSHRSSTLFTTKFNQVLYVAIDEIFGSYA